ncbi:HNH endonuclease [Chryseobacterium fluminis]|uniref:HNH endonuclease n=1 Tax=Chryseobacterium fluminis TaxID=2983606 RepID=UPI002258910E|nr:HNH endonuclease [Chryseobacterium sp. MMS21-Ot14]UZT98210.1 HNH endonuclease [Chryseobacterium sp. MMS21-Ot14]
MKLENDLLKRGYYTHFKSANTSLANAIASDAKFAAGISDLGIKIPTSATGNILGKSPTNWVWHHDIGEGVMQLVPKSQHPSIPGGSFWKIMHPNNGKGGMSIWGK